MITCTKNEDGSYTLSNLSPDDLEIIEEGVGFLFSQSRREAHREFRRQTLRITSPISGQLDRLEALTNISEHEKDSISHSDPVPDNRI